jgi:hypothetical protein
MLKVMTHRYNILVAAVVGLAIGTGLYQARRATRLAEEQSAMANPEMERLGSLQEDRDRAVNELGIARRQLENAHRDAQEAARLRVEITKLSTAQPVDTLKDRQFATTAAVLGDLSEKAGLLRRELEKSPERSIPELQLLDDHDWLEAAGEVKSGSEEEIGNGLSRLRTLAKDKLAPILGSALNKYCEANGGRIPGDFAELKPYFRDPVDDGILARYRLSNKRNLNEIRPGEGVIQERARVEEQDILHWINTDRYFHLTAPESVKGPDGRVVTTTSMRDFEISPED